ncbi:RNA polymerase sigma factor SigJ [Actinoplanes sp. NPDC048796]|uniref:RNA polymerase sigma factor SigJ n=1 Tax=unclassified Actinoplanes TaxID=2626549 RepID=UPI0033D3065A
MSAITVERRQLLTLAYRMTGSLADAEDVVQETYARWYALTHPQRDAIDNPAAWLTTVASRVCLDLLGSARSRRERYVGAWIPEPLPAGYADLSDRVTQDESLTMAFLIVLDAMTPAERVAFLLHDVFGYPFAEIATVLGRTPVACRKLASSARRRVGESRVPRTPPSGQARVVRAFKQAWEAKDIGALIALLDPDAVVTADGGGQVSTVRHPLHGRDQIARHAASLFRVMPGMDILERTVNGHPGLVVQLSGVTVTVLAFELAPSGITRVWAIRNPAKLGAWTA